MNYGKIENGKLVRFASTIRLATSDGDEDYEIGCAELAEYRAIHHIYPIEDIPCPCERGKCPCVCGCHYDDDDNPTKIVIDYEAKDIDEADAHSLAVSLQGQDISTMTDREKTTVIQKLADVVVKTLSVFALMFAFAANADDTYQRTDKGDLRDSDKVVVTIPTWAQGRAKPSYTAIEVGAPTTSQFNTLRDDVISIANFIDGSNVTFNVTNYISGVYSAEHAKLTIKELRVEDGQYHEVYSSKTDWDTNWLANINTFKSDYLQPILDDMDLAIAQKLDRAWGNYTSSGSLAPSNTVYMTAPNTVFAGGMEYERVAVGEGMVGVLVNRGAPVWTQGDEGTFKFQDDGGTNYFGFAKSDSYVIGARTDNITVQGGLVTLTYDVSMSGVPCVWYKQNLADSIPWEQLNTSDGLPITGASHLVSWEQNPDPNTEVCYLNCEDEPQGFFKATIEVQGSAKFMTNMPADLSGGIFCTDGIHKVKIDWNNGSPRLIEAE